MFYLAYSRHDPQVAEHAVLTAARLLLDVGADPDAGDPLPLLRLGANPDLRDHRFGSTPLGWARYFGHQPLIDSLEPLTAPEPERAPPE